MDPSSDVTSESTPQTSSRPRFKKIKKYGARKSARSHPGNRKKERKKRKEGNKGKEKERGGRIYRNNYWIIPIIAAGEEAARTFTETVGFIRRREGVRREREGAMERERHLLAI